jgi:hypothetical protein
MTTLRFTLLRRDHLFSEEFNDYVCTEAEIH